MVIKKKNNKGFFFSTDALIALMIIVVVVGIALPVVAFSRKDSNLQGDILSVVSHLQVGEMCYSGAYPSPICSSGSCGGSCVPEPEEEDYNKSIIEQIGKLYIEYDEATAKILGDTVLAPIPDSENIEILLIDDTIGEISISKKFIKPYADTGNIEVANYIVSGVDLTAVNAEGFSSSAFLKKTKQSRYYYFGGYIGDGDITVNMDLDCGASCVVKEFVFEGVINEDMDIVVNGDTFDTNIASSGNDFIPTYYNNSDPLIIIPSLKTETSNAIVIKSSNGKNLYIAGGYIRIDYETELEYKLEDKKYFPGISGTNSVVNLYDSFYVPGNIDNISTHIVAESPTKNIYMKIGNITIFNQTFNAGDFVENTTAEIQAALGGNFNNYEKVTVPIRIGIQGVDYVNHTVIPDIMSVTGLAGNLNSVTGMNDTDGDGIAEDELTKVETIRQVNRDLVDQIISALGNASIGFAVEHNKVVEPAYYRSPSRDIDDLKANIDSWPATGTYYTCEAFQAAVEELIAIKAANPGTERFQSIILPVYKHDFNDCFGLPNPADALKDYACNIAPANNIHVFTVSIGLVPGGVAQDMIDALDEIAVCTGGTYTDAGSGGSADLIAAYQEIIQEILGLAYNMQTVDVTAPGSADAKSTISPDSYIAFNYSGISYSPGITINIVKNFSEPGKGNFTIPLSNADVLDTRITSYSGPFWSNELDINANEVYNLTLFDEDYLQLGDPYPINIPSGDVNPGVNDIDLSVGPRPEISLPGSGHNKIIYTINRRTSVFTNILDTANGCSWNITFFDGTIKEGVEVPVGATESCDFLTGVYDSNDATQTAVYNLLKLLDFDSDGKVDVNLDVNNLEIDSSGVSGVPFADTAIVQVRKWY
jgi:hypothetical protein